MNKNLRIIIFYGHKGGVGTSTVLATISKKLKKHKSTCCVEFRKNELEIPLSKYKIVTNIKKLDSVKDLISDLNSSKTPEYLRRMKYLLVDGNYANISHEDLKEISKLDNEKFIVTVSSPNEIAARNAVNNAKRLKELHIRSIHIINPVKPQFQEEILTGLKKTLKDSDTFVLNYVKNADTSSKHIHNKKNRDAIDSVATRLKIEK